MQAVGYEWRWPRRLPLQAFNGAVVAIQVPGTDCEIDYDGDLDDDRFRAIDGDYDMVWDWLDPDMGYDKSRQPTGRITALGFG